MNIHTMEGAVYKEDAPVTDSLDHFLQKGYGWWVNDSYWLVMPYKLKDSGVTLTYLGEDTTVSGSPADVIQLTFENVGLTAQNVYKVWIDTDSKLVNQWAYFPNDETTEPNFITPWSDYQTYGGILLAGNRGDYNLEGINVYQTVPENIFKDHNVTIESLQ